VTDTLVIAGSRDKKVYALDRASGVERWSHTTDGQVDGSPVVVGERVYVGCLSNDGNFYVLDLKTGRKIQEINLDSAVTSSPAVGGDCVLVGSDKGTLYCFGKR
jgi:outer membrane protein assembly factor BamB